MPLIQIVQTVGFILGMAATFIFFVYGAKECINVEAARDVSLQLRSIQFFLLAIWSMQIVTCLVPLRRDP
jgi:hypothetical protein